MPDERSRAAELFDLRRIIGGLFTVLGVLLIVLGLFASDADIEQAAGVNINLWAGVGMLALGLLFIAWALWRPLRLEEPGGPSWGDGEGAAGDDDAGR